ncbi:MAG: hypothetical protein ABSG51_00780 [Terracidiphilus sp.]|jgi:hypothetical protein
MPLAIQRAVLDLITQVTSGAIETTTPEWLNRPGMSECGGRWELICHIYRELTDLALPDKMPPREWRKVDGILKCANRSVRIVEIDESQHFNCYRGKTLLLYPREIRLAFDRRTWIEHSTFEPRQQSGSWASPRPPLFSKAGGRHLQRAFRDALTDILPPDRGFLPTLRIADFEVNPWIGAGCALERMKELLDCKLSN